MIQFTKKVRIAGQDYATWQLDNIDGSVLLTACIVTRKEPEGNEVIIERRSWLRPNHTRLQDAGGRLGSESRYQSSPETEPIVPVSIKAEAVQHFRDQIRFKRWADR